MSVIRVDNFGPSAGGTTYSARGIAKAWVNFDGTGTIAARDSENVSSLTDNGTGDYTFNLTNAFAAADYAPTAVCCSGTIEPQGNGSQFLIAASSLRLGNYAGAFVDRDLNLVSAHGDLA